VTGATSGALQDKPFRDRFVVAGNSRRQEIEAPERVYLPSGTFRMGGESGPDNEKLVHLVRLDAFAIGRTPHHLGATTSASVRPRAVTGPSG